MFCHCLMQRHTCLVDVFATRGERLLSRGDQLLDKVLDN